MGLLLAGVALAVVALVCGVVLVVAVAGWAGSLIAAHGVIVVAVGAAVGLVVLGGTAALMIAMAVDP